MGRPKGSLNKKTKKKIMMKRKRGRPRKVIEKVAEKLDPVVPTRKSKFIGFCPKCYFMVAKTELVSKFIYECPSCGKRARISTLKKEKPTLKTYSNQKDYLSSTINADHYDMPSMHDPDIAPKDLKIQDS